MELQQKLEEVDLQKYWLVLKRRWLPATGVCGLVVALSALVTITQKPLYEAEARTLVKLNPQTALIGLTDNSQELQALDARSSPLTTQAEVVRSLPVAQRVIKSLKLEDEAGKPLDPRDFQSNLTVRPVGGTDVLRIIYQANDPKVAAAVVNEVATAYTQQTIADKRKEAGQASEFIGEQLPRVEAAVIEAESALRQFKESNGVVALPEEATSAVKVIADLQTQLAQAQAQYGDASARVAVLQNQLGMSSEQALAISSLSQAAGVQDILLQLQQAQSELAVSRTRYQQKHPTIANQERKVAALDTSLRSRVGEILGSQGAVSLGDLQIGDVERGVIANFVQAEAERSGLDRQVRTLAGTEASYRARASALPRLEQTQRQLDRQLQAAQTTYETLLTRLQEIQVSENQDVGNARLISPALPPEFPISPKKPLNLILGGIVGLLAGIATAFTLDLVDKSLKTIREAKELFGYTLLGVIPAFSRCGKVRHTSELDRSIPRVVSRDCPQSPVNEAFQMLQANLKFLSSDKEIKALVVTSSAPREGKSEVSANLAAAIAQLGSRVLLVDADMRHPMQHHAWDVTNSPGLSNVLVDQTDFQSVVHPVMPNLDVLTAGVIPPNPAAILDSKRMASLIDAFSQEYDFVVFDTPPLSGTIDAAVLGKMVDGILLVVRPGVVNTASATAAREFLAQSGQKVLGIVANGVDVRNEPDSYFYYSREYQSGRQALPASSAVDARALAAARSGMKKP